MTFQRMPPGERDKRMDDLASKAAAAYCRKYANDTDEQIEASPEVYLQHSIPYLTVRTLQREENALKSLETDSRVIKWFAIATVVLTCVLAFYACRLDVIVHSLQEKPIKSVEPTRAPAGARGSP